MKIHPLGAEFFRVEGRTDRQLQTYRHYVANSRFLQICERVYKPSDLTVAAVRSKCGCNVTFSL